MCVISSIQKNLHLGVYGLIQKKNHILVIRKSRGPYIGLLDLPGGRPHHGESLLHALKREIREETGIIATNYSLFDNFSFLTTYKDTDGLQKQLYHVALIYNVTDFDSEQYNSSITAEDVNGSLWINKDVIIKKNSSPLLQAIVENNK
ncbi:MAG: NUDIX domain-containing protein [Chlamydiales bacterium]